MLSGDPGASRMKSQNKEQKNKKLKNKKKSVFIYNILERKNIISMDSLIFRVF